MNRLDEIELEETEIANLCREMQARKAQIEAEASNKGFWANLNDSTAALAEIPILEARLRAAPVRLKELAAERATIQLEAQKTSMPAVLEALDDQYAKLREFRLFMEELEALAKVAKSEKENVRVPYEQSLNHVRNLIASMVQNGLDAPAANEYRAALDRITRPVTSQEIEARKAEARAKFFEQWGVKNDGQERANIVPPPANALPDNFQFPQAEGTWRRPTPNETHHVSHTHSSGRG